MSSIDNPTSCKSFGQKRLILVLIGVFLCGCVVGGAATRVVVRYQLRAALRNPEDLASRISPKLVHAIGLRVEQRTRIEDLIDKHYVHMEALRAETYPKQLAEFDTLCSEIEAELDANQQKKWSALVNRLREDYLPVAPVTPPSTDFLFGNFDSDANGFLERSEVPPRMWFHVSRADSNSDGFVSIPEFESARSKRIE